MYGALVTLSQSDRVPPPSLSGPACHTRGLHPLSSSRMFQGGEGVMRHKVPRNTETSLQRLVYLILIQNGDRLRSLDIRYRPVCGRFFESLSSFGLGPTKVDPGARDGYCADRRDPDLLAGLCVRSQRTGGVDHCPGGVDPPVLVPRLQGADTPEGFQTPEAPQARTRSCPQLQSRGAGVHSLYASYQVCKNPVQFHSSPLVSSPPDAAVRLSAPPFDPASPRIRR